MKRLLMVYLIIEWLHSEKQRLWLEDDTRAPAFWHGESVDAFLGGDGALASVCISHSTLRDNNHSR